MTDLRSESLSAEAYGHLMAAAGPALLEEPDDDGRNHYYISVKR